MSTLLSLSKLRCSSSLASGLKLTLSYTDVCVCLCTRDDNHDDDDDGDNIARAHHLFVRVCV